MSVFRFLKISVAKAIQNCHWMALASLVRRCFFVLVCESWINRACASEPTECWSLSHLLSVVLGMRLQQFILPLYRRVVLNWCLFSFSELILVISKYLSLDCSLFLGKYKSMQENGKVRSELFTTLSLFLLRLWWCVPIIPALGRQVN